MSHQQSLEPHDSNWRMRAMLAGGIIGSLIGTVAAYLYVRASEETTQDGAPPRLDTREAISIGMALVRMVRLIADMGTRK